MEIIQPKSRAFIHRSTNHNCWFFIDVKVRNKKQEKREDFHKKNLNDECLEH